MSNAPTLDDLRPKLDAIGQSHVLRHAEELDEAGKAKLAGQLGQLNLDEIGELAESYVKTKPEVSIPSQIDPPTVMPRTPASGHVEMYEKAAKRGKEMLENGEVAAFLVAGGQGTRLGYDGPKGEYPVTPVREKPLFQVFAEQVKAAGDRHGKPVPWYIMTSELNDQRTRAFFDKHNYFGLPKDQVFFFAQGMMPAFDMDGKLLLAGKDSLALSPDGHGGSLRALARSGALADMEQRGVKHLSYFQVDNPLVHVIDPLFLGLHDQMNSDMSSKTIAKAEPKEKVGNFCVADGTLTIIEYSDLPDELAESTNDDGSLKFNAGSIAIHVLAVDFVKRLTSGGKLDLPWHRAEKKVPHIDEAGNDVAPQSPNAVKLEQFVFDAIPLAKNPLVLETIREEEFSPVKNAEGGSSPETSRRDQVRRAARWLAKAGVEVPHDDAGEPAVILEISPLFASSAEETAEKELPPTAIQAGSRIYHGD